MTLRDIKLIVLAAIAAGVAASTAMARESPRLLFEVTVDDSLVARPELRVPSGGEGRIELREKQGDARVTFAPTVRGDGIVIKFDITDGDKRLRPTLVITETTPGFIEWTSPAQGQTVRLAVSWAR
jgi:hypothetical protein